jgi:hypothetical protein
VSEVLTPQDRQSAVWKKIAAHLDERLAALRVKNDGPHDAIQTAKIRGAIAEVIALQKLDSDPVVIENESAKFRDS